MTDNPQRKHHASAIRFCNWIEGRDRFRSLTTDRVQGTANET
ncbi:MAG: hypothetical protein QGG98_00725 [Pseudomonadales bacterium]|nr:hypothetical protein [Pseudomonadales bacterium]